VGQQIIGDLRSWVAWCGVAIFGRSWSPAVWTKSLLTYLTLVVLAAEFDLDRDVPDTSRSSGTADLCITVTPS
jgi:hypothetical protein